MASAYLPIVNLAVYRAGIYRLLSMLLANQRIESDADSRFSDLCGDHADAEIVPLLIQIAAISRQHLDLLDGRDSSRHADIASSICGNYFSADKGERKLAFKTACNHIVHAHDITLFVPGNKDVTDAPDSESIKIVCFPNTQDGIAETRVTNLGFKEYLRICIILSNLLKENTS